MAVSMGRKPSRLGEGFQLRPSARAAVIRGAREDLLPIRQNNAAGVDGIRSVFCSRAIHGYGVADFQRIFSPAVSVETIRCAAFASVVDDLAGCLVLHVDIEIDVWIHPLDFGDLA